MVVVVEKERGCLLIFSYPSKTRDTRVTGAGFTDPPVTSTRTGL